MQEPRNEAKDEAALELTMYEFMVVYVAVSRMLDQLRQRRTKSGTSDQKCLNLTTFEFRILYGALSRALEHADKCLRNSRRNQRRAGRGRQAA